MIGRLAIVAAGAIAIAAPAAGQPVPADYVPKDKDERGLWMQLDTVERGLKTSEFVVRDPALNTYVRGVLCRTVGDAHCAAIRLYIVRTAEFNATMAPNGMMTVYTGLLLRMRDEAQLAAILGHEYTHFSERHSLKGFRDSKTKAGAIAWLSVVPMINTAAGAAVTLAQVMLVGSHYRFSRTMESDADAGSVPLMRAAGYDPAAAPAIWDQLRAEQAATAAARNRRPRKNDDRGFFASHPPAAERVTALNALVARGTRPPTSRRDRDAYRAALASWWPQLLDDQIKLNDFGATDYLLRDLASDGWSPALLYARGELYRTRGRPDDLVQAAGFYRDALAAGANAEAWRGLGLAQLRSGETMAGRAALHRYLAAAPVAPDRALIASLAGGER